MPFDLTKEEAQALLDVIVHFQVLSHTPEPECGRLRSVEQKLERFVGGEPSEPETPLSDQVLLRVQFGMLGVIEAGELAGRTRDQVLDEFPMDRSVLEPLLAGDFDAVRKAARARKEVG